jgi:hypothetical protein
MTKNYFAIERNGECIEHLILRNEEGKILFEDLMDMSYEEMKEYEYIEEFIVGAMDAMKTFFEDDKDDYATITLIDPDDRFIWGIILGPGDNEDDIKYVFVDWQKDGKTYKYV